MTAFVPNGFELATWGAVLLAAALMMGLGRLLSGGRSSPEIALVTGWGFTALLLTLWGVSTPTSLRIPGYALAVAGGIGAVAPGCRLSRAEWRSLWRTGALALPLIAVLASARPSLTDTFSNLLPNAAYLYDFASFPADERPPAHSFLPGAPYNLQLASFFASLALPGFPASAMIDLNLLLFLGAGLLLGRLVAGSETGTDAAPSWSATALGLLLATGLNPGFVPRYHLSAYGEASTAVAVAVAGWLVLRLLAEDRDRRSAWLAPVELGLSLAALINIRQDSVALVVGILVSGMLLALLGRSPRAFVRLVAAAVPAAILYLAWRWYVLEHFAVGELKPLPIGQWQFDALPFIFWRMLQVMFQKIVFFGALAAVLVALVWRVRHRMQDQPTRAAGLTAGVFAVYNAALVAAYIGHFPGTTGTDAHSYFRYNTHLSLLTMIALVLLLRAPLRARLGAMLRRAAPAAIAAMLVAPVLFVGFLRFDLEIPQQRLWALAAEAAPLIGRDDRLALVVPGDNTTVATMLEGVLRMTPPRRPTIEVQARASLDPATLASLAADGYRRALVSCVPGGFALAPAGTAAFLVWREGAWRAEAVWSYPPVPRDARWSAALATAALCL